ncbi:MAG: polysaccharide deacetylase family protein [Myxococcota bacterium]
MPPERRVALTFDDGPGPSTGRLLEVLDRHGVQVTFFVVGKNLRGHALGSEPQARALAIRAAQAGHQLGNHADTHLRDPMPMADFIAEIRAVDALIDGLYAEAGVASPRQIPFRLPYGPLVRGKRQDERLVALTAAGKRHQHWTIILGDYKPTAQPGRLFSKLLAHVEEMWALDAIPIIVLHDAGAWPQAHGYARVATVEAVDRLLDALRPLGAQFVFP